jgi:hypothetical protein
LKTRPVTHSARSGASNDLQASPVRRQAWRIAVTFAAVLAVVASIPFHVEAASCGSDPKDVRAAIKKHVETMRALEREAADRLKGLDTRTFDYLLGQTRAVARVIADKDALAAEEELSRCSESIPPVRRVCAEAAQALTSLIEARAAGTADKAPKQLYAQAMPQCERWMDFPPLNTLFRIPD